MKTIVIIFISLLSSNLLFAQHVRFVTEGTIEYEKTINMFGITRNEIGNKPYDWQIQEFERYKATKPQFVKLKSTLVFSKNKSLFTPIAPEQVVESVQNNPMSKQFNTIYTDLSTHTSISQKDIYGDMYLVKDSTRKIKWKLTDETREIAGYTCRRANGLILDSVYVVAFYTDKIWVSSGPESFSGLPGMILGVVLPHENVNWYATKVTDTSVLPTSIAAPKKGKIMNNKQLADMLKDAMKNWGTAGPNELKIFSL
jgi:GLPGLI family protein